MMGEVDDVSQPPKTLRWTWCEGERHYELTRLLSFDFVSQIFSLLPLTAPFALTSNPTSSSSHTTATSSSTPSSASAADATSSATQISSLEGEVARLKADLVKAKALNDKMWEGVVAGSLGTSTKVAGAAGTNASVPATAPVKGSTEGGGGKRRR